MSKLLLLKIKRPLHWHAASCVGSLSRYEDLSDDSIQLVRRWKSGDEQAAEEIFDRYVARLIALASSKISPGLARRVEAEDVVQSVYRSFFARVSDERLQIDQNGELWGLLAAITVNKVRAKARFHGAGKRDINAEASVAASEKFHGLAPDEIARDPTADEITMIAEQYNEMLQRLSPIGRQVFQLHLESVPIDQIASRVRRSARTVRRELEQIRRLLTDALATSNDT